MCPYVVEVHNNNYNDTCKVLLVRYYVVDIYRQGVFSKLRNV